MLAAASLALAAYPAPAAGADAQRPGGRLCATRDGRLPGATLFVRDPAAAEATQALAISVAGALWFAVDTPDAGGVSPLRDETGRGAGALVRRDGAWVATITVDDVDCRLAAATFRFGPGFGTVRSESPAGVAETLAVAGRLHAALELRALDDVEGARKAFAALDEPRTLPPALALRIRLEQIQHAIDRSEFDRATAIAVVAKELAADGSALPPGLALYARHVAARARYSVGDDAGLLEARAALSNEWASLLDPGHADVLANQIEWAVVESATRLADAQARLAPAFTAVLATLPPGDPLRSRAISMRAALLVDADDPIAAIDLLRGEYAALTAASAARGLALARVIRRWGYATVAAQRPLDALPLLREATLMYERLLGPENTLTLDARETYALALARLGRYGEAIAIQRLLVAAYASRLRDSDPLLANTRLNLAVWLNRQGRPRDALPILLHLLAAQAQRGEASDDVAVEAWIEVGVARLALGELAAACAASAEAVTLAARSSLVSDETRQNARFAEALCMARDGRRDDAIAALDAVFAARVARNGMASRDVLNTRAALARVYLDAGRGGDARRELEALAAATEILREREIPDSALGRTGFSGFTESSPSRAGVRDLAYLDASEGKVRDAILRAESARARSVTDAFGWRVALTGMPQRDQARAAALAARQRSLDARIALLPLAARERVVLEDERSVLAAEIDAVRGRNATANAAGGDFDAFRRTLGPGTAFVGVQIVHGGAWAFVLRGDRPATAVLLPEAVTVVPALPALRTAWAEPQGRLARIWRMPDGDYVNALASPAPGAREVSVAELTRSVSRALVAPLAPLLTGITRVVIAGDGATAGLPWEALESATGVPLGARFEIAYAPSLAAAMSVPAPGARRVAPRGVELVAIGAPPYELADPSPDDGTPFAGRRWEPLPGAAAEIAAIAGFYPPARRSIVAGADATKSRFDAMARAGELGGARVVHIAAHGYLSADQPQWSALVLRGEGNSLAYITAAELATFDLGADLVVLSACETALGKDVAGEGLFGLPYALTVAGARATLLTLWPVSDASAAAFMTRFYSKLARGVAPATALAATKREFMRIPAYAAPFHWAPYVLVGG